jgi:hypothetical protein
MDSEIFSKGEIIMAKVIMNVDGSGVVEQEVNVPDFADMSLLDTTTKPDGSRESIYQLAGTDPEHVLTVRVGVYPRTVGGKKRTSASIRLSTFTVDTATDPDEYEPCDITLAMNMPGGSVVPDVNTLRYLIDAVWQFYIRGNNLGKLQFGITNDLLAD